METVTFTQQQLGEISHWVGVYADQKARRNRAILKDRNDEAEKARKEVGIALSKLEEFGIYP